MKNMAQDDGGDVTGGQDIYKTKTMGNVAESDKVAPEPKPAQGA